MCSRQKVHLLHCGDNDIHVVIGLHTGDTAGLEFFDLKRFTDAAETHSFGILHPFQEIWARLNTGLRARFSTPVPLASYG